MVVVRQDVDALYKANHILRAQNFAGLAVYR